MRCAFHRRVAWCDVCGGSDQYCVDIVKKMMNSIIVLFIAVTVVMLTLFIAQLAVAYASCRMYLFTRTDT